MNGLPRSVRYENVRELFDKCGEIEDLHIKTKYAFIKYKKHEDAVYAIKELHDTMYEGQKLTVERSCKYYLPLLLQRVLSSKCNFQINY